MSIPPLVCSTPPPPDQCDDDKEQDDFDIHYSLSQEEDDERNQYDFCTYHNLNSKEEIINNTNVEPTLLDNGKISTEVPEILNNVGHSKCGSVTPNQVNIKVDEDNNIEDLDLQLEQVTVKDVPEDTNKRDLDKDSAITDTSPTVSGNETTESSPSLSSGLDMSFTESCNNQVAKVTSINETVKAFINEENNSNNKIVVILSNELKADVIQNISNDISQIDLQTSSKDVLQDVGDEDTVETEQTNDNIVVSEQLRENCDPLERSPKTNDRDDFGDFDDFQFANPSVVENVSTVINYNDDNPWANDDSRESFGEFHANFDDFKTNDLDTIHGNDNTQKEISHQVNVDTEDDGFGDFDDFKSSAAEVNKHITEEDKSSQADIPVFNLETSNREIQSGESIAKIIESVFQEQIMEPDEIYEKMLESSLCETWGHLLDTEVRQPYMVNWNNSLGQKTLLRALCIDSRNILFGPKWGNTPRYAANLGAAPLQPVKQTSKSQSQNENISIDKQMRTPDSWKDPFSTNEQEFTYAEALLLDLEHLMATLDQMAHNHSSVKISDLLSHACNNDGGETVEAKSVREEPTSKKYPSTLNIQPLRQINLPDTHIYTPTDSETPRSKTIHYDSGPSILVSQSLNENKERLCENLTDPGLFKGGNSFDDNEYSDFQDFKGVMTKQSQELNNLESSISSPSNATTNVILQSQSILEPVKIEPIMPTLNWPDPGQVKETFDDFSDFVSNSSWFKDKNDQDTVGATNALDAAVNFDTTFKNANSEIQSSTKEKVNGLDDDFDTFQSATPPQPTSLHSNVPSIKPNDTKCNEPFQFAFPEMQNQVNFHGASNNNLPQVNTQKENTTPLNANKNLVTKKPSNSTMSTQVLQPTPASTTKQGTAQILQPLSLEGISQINWPNPGIDLQDLSRFNPVEKVRYLQTEASSSSPNKGASPNHNAGHLEDDDGWGDFVSSKPKQHISTPKKQACDDDEWSDFVSSPSVRGHNGLNTISLNVHTNLNIQKSMNHSKYKQENKQIDIPSLNYVTPKGQNYRGLSKVSNQHFQNL